MSQIVLFFGFGPKTLFVDNLAQKASTHKTLSRLGFQQTNFWKNGSPSRNGRFWKKTRNSSYLCFCFFFSLNNKNKNAQTPISIVL